MVRIIDQHAYHHDDLAPGDSSNLNGGVVAAIIVGTVAIIIGAVVGSYSFYRRRRHASNNKRLTKTVREGLLEYATGGPGLRGSLGGQGKPGSMKGKPSTPPERAFRSSPKSSSPDSPLQDTIPRHLASPDTEGSHILDRNLGKLNFTVNYDNQKQVLLVTVVSCQELPEKDPQMSTSDPYVKLQLLPEKRHRVKTRVLRRTTNPVYEETFTFFGLTLNQIKATSLHFVVLSFDRFSRDDVIGEVLCSLADLDLSLKQDIPATMDIQPRQFKLKNENRGELLVSLCYQPAAKRLTVVVLKARNLPKMDVTGLAGDPYVKLYMLYNGQRIAKKKSHVKKRTLNPVFNESFAFEIPAEENLSDVSVELFALDWDRVTKNEVIGRLELGIGKGELAEKHWMDIMNNPRKQVAEWHKLRE